MKNIFSILLVFVIASTVKAQLVVNTGMTPTQYVQNVLVGGGVTVSNVTFTGAGDQIGDFDATNTNPFLGLNTGVVLGTGDVTVATGNNTGTGTALGGSGTSSSDPDILSLIGGGISANDAAILEFDFIPIGDTVRFNYVFGSEEYPEYVNSINDVFGFFLSGPGIAGPYTNGAENIALVPGTTTPVTINTVNSGSNPSYYIDNNSTSGPQSIEYDGYTTVMTAIGVVQCGVQYHIKIAIADASDGGWDSGVFLEGGSFSSNTVTLSSNIDITNGDSILYEGCGSALFDFVRDNSLDTSVYYYSVSGTANGADYSISADSVLFLPGVDTVTLTFDAINDGVVEPLETIIIELVQTICSVVDTQTVTFYISDFPQIQLNMHDTMISCGSTDTVPVWVDVLGPPSNILWNTGATTDTIWVLPNISTTYTVTVSDTCGVSVVSDSATVTFVPVAPISLTMSNDTSLYCPQDSALIYVTPSGGAGYTYSWNGGQYITDSVMVNPNVTQYYVVDVVDMCGSVATDSVLVTVPNYVPLTNVITTNDTTICPGEVVTLNANVNGGIGTYLTWDNGVGNVVPTNVNPAITTNYILTAQDSCGAMVMDSVLVTVNTVNAEVTVQDYTMNCLNETVVLTANVNGGSPFRTYLWSTGSTTDTIMVSPSTTLDYWVEVTDVCNIDSDTATVTVPVFAPLVLTINNDTAVSCPEDNLVLSALVVGGAQLPLTINWSDGINNFTGNNIVVNPIITTTYTAWVEDNCAFDGDTVSFTVTVPTYGPLQLLISEDTLVCVGSPVQLFAAATGGEGTYNYLWNGTMTSDTIDFNANYDYNYSVMVIDGCGQQVSGLVTVNVTKPTAAFTYEYIGENEVEFTDSSYENIVNNWWMFNSSDSTLETVASTIFENAGEHEVWLAVKDINGCYDTVYQIITPPIFLYAPNAFTPEGNGLNDFFKLEGMGIESFHMMIFDRWGEKLFESIDIDNGWDGSYKGQLLPNGVYVYRVTAYSYEGRKILKVGSVNLVR